MTSWAPVPFGWETMGKPWGNHGETHDTHGFPQKDWVNLGKQPDSCRCLLDYGWKSKVKTMLKPRDLIFGLGNLCCRCGEIEWNHNRKHVEVTPKIWDNSGCRAKKCRISNPRQLKISNYMEVKKEEFKLTKKMGIFHCHVWLPKGSKGIHCVALLCLAWGLLGTNSSSGTHSSSETWQTSKAFYPQLALEDHLPNGENMRKRYEFQVATNQVKSSSWVPC